MKIFLGLLVGLSYIICGVLAQTKYHPHPVSQEVQYDDDEPTYGQHPYKYGLVREPSSGGYESQLRGHNGPVYYRPVSSPYPQPEHSHHAYPQNYNIPSTERQKYHQTADIQAEEPSYPQPKDHPYPQTKDIYQREPEYHRTDAGYPKPASGDENTREPVYEKSEELQYSHEPEPENYKQHSAEPEKPYAPPAVRDPKLPLYFTMYEKRIIQDPTDKYGKGPWRYLTYGHGITYGSKEPGKVFEKGYGYIRALGRDHCKLPENLCPKRDDKPFEYEGRKEPYFGYRPH